MKIFLTLLLTSTLLSATPSFYMGAKIGYSSMQTNLHVKGLDHDAISGDLFSFLHKEKLRLSAVTFGVLSGVSYKISDKTSSFVELDFGYAKKKSKRRNIAMKANNQAGATLNNETFSVTQGHALGIMPGLEFGLNEKISCVAGVRLKVTQYQVSAASKAPRSLGNKEKKKVLMFSFEPTIGLKYAVTEKISTRLTVGYSFAKRKKITRNYIKNESDLNEGEYAAVYINPRGINVNVAAIYTF